MNFTNSFQKCFLKCVSYKVESYVRGSCHISFGWLCCRLSLGKVWPLDEERQHPVGTQEKCRLSGPAPALLNQNLRFNKS